MTSSTKAKTKKEVVTDDDDDDLLDEMEDPFVGEEWDLLNEMEEDDSEGWVAEERGDAIQGVVIKTGTTNSDYSDEPVPTVTIETKDGTKYRIIGYSTVLGREIKDANPEKGDKFAVKYWGQKTAKRGKGAGKPYHHYSILCRKRTPVTA